MNKPEDFLVNGWVSKRWKRSLALAHARTQSQLLRETAFEGKPAFDRARDYLRLKAVSWLWHYLRSRFGRRWRFLDYTNCKGDNGIYELAAGSDACPSDPVRICLASDWGTGTCDANRVANCIKGHSPHLTVHLGDIYYVGTKKEIHEHMLGKQVSWPMGSYGSFALNANHEMYSGGKGYFKHLLPKLGLRNANGTNSQQHASFFCLKNESWLVVGLDTGYHSVGIPVVEKIFKPSAKLHEKLLRWLRDEVRIHEDAQRGLILLSHHQYYSQFESGYSRPAKQLAELIERPVLWFWGHEHRLAIYGKSRSPKTKLNAYGRCIGHGGLPIEDIEDQPMPTKNPQVRLVLYDRRERKKIGSRKTPIGYNGYASLVFKGSELTVEYRDTQGVLVEEIWRVGNGGVLRGISIRRRSNHSDLTVHNGANLGDAIA